MRKLTQKEWIAVAVGVCVVALFFIIPRFSASTTPAEQTSPTTVDPKVTIVEKVAGTGAEAKLGSAVEVHYTGMFTDGVVFDSSVPRGEPLPFVLGDQGLIQGFTAGVLGMKVGGKRVVTIPPELGYGAGAYGPIPANSTLIFELELVSVK